jgi:MerR family transcriptional regulator, repressor of the yfmOP operon
MNEKIMILEEQELNKLITKVDKIYEFFLQLESNQNNEWIQPQDALNLLGVSSRTLQKYRDTGAVGFSQVSRKKILYRKSDIDKMLEGKYVPSFKTKK